MKYRIGLDIDDCLCDFLGAYYKRYPRTLDSWRITRNVEKLKLDKDFWMNLEVINLPDFEPTLFCTKRVIPKQWTKDYLWNLGFDQPVYQRFYQCGSKASMIKGRVDIFVDDSVRNFIDMNLKGVPCLLLDNEANQDWGPIGRVFSLDYVEIEDTYQLLKSTIGNNFKNLL